MLKSLKYRSSQGKTLHIHIGIMKTGSTAIQTYLYKNFEELFSSRIMYPNLNGHGFGWQNSRGFSSGNAHVGEGETLGWHLEQTVPLFLDYDHVILSYEVLYLGAAKEKFWSELDTFILKNDVSVNVFGYLRDPFDYFISSYQQALKDLAYSADLEDYVNDYPKTYFSFVYREFLRIWTLASSSLAELSFFRYEDAKSDIIEHFFKTACQISGYSPLKSGSFPNKALGLIEQEILKGINEVSPKVGRLFAFELQDTLRSSENREFNTELTYTLSDDAQEKLEVLFEEYRRQISQVLPFAGRVDYSVTSPKLVDELSTLNLEIRHDLRNLGNIIGRFGSTGYLLWQIKQDLQKNQENS